MASHRTSSDSFDSTASTATTRSSSSYDENAAMSLCEGRKVTSDIPRPFDIICGRGSRVSSANLGNHRFREEVEKRKEEYQRASRREEKTRITMEVVQSLTEGTNGSRFMLKDPDTAVWYDAGMDYAKEKVSHALRSRAVTEDERQRRKHMRQSQQQRQRLEQQQNAYTSNLSNNSQRQSQRRSQTSHNTPQLSLQMESLVEQMIVDQQNVLAALIQRHNILPETPPSRNTADREGDAIETAAAARPTATRSSRRPSRRRFQQL